MTEPEFSHPLPVEKIPVTGIEKTLEAKEAERQRLAERFGLLELPKLQAELSIEPMRPDQTIPVTGKVVADVVQQCVVTLEPLVNRVEYNIDVLYTPPELADAGAGAVDPGAPETEVIVDGIIDLGELVAQHLGIALDPYPRKPGASFAAAEYGTTASVPKSPFAQLAEWSKKPKE